MKKGVLYLLPATLGDSGADQVIPAANVRVIQSLRHFIAEDVRSARRFLKKAFPGIVINDLSFGELNEHTLPRDIPGLLKPLEDGHDTGLLPEAGMPCVADPGAVIVEMAHKAGIRVVPLTGPSSILMALAASGFNGQQFAFLGYLPADSGERTGRIRDIEKTARQTGQTQIFIETPYRNDQMLQSLLMNCLPDTRLCVAVNLTMPDELIISKSIRDWKASQRPGLHKKPAVFLLCR